MNGTVKLTMRNRLYIFICILVSIVIMTLVFIIISESTVLGLSSKISILSDQLSLTHKLANRVSGGMADHYPDANTYKKDLDLYSSNIDTLINGNPSLFFGAERDAIPLELFDSWKSTYSVFRKQSESLLKTEDSEMQKQLYATTGLSKSYGTLNEIIGTLQTNYSTRVKEAFLGNIRISVILFVCMVLLGIISLFVVHRSVNPIKKLIRTIMKIADSDFSSRTESPRNDEIGLIGKALNIMTEKTETLIRDIKKTIANVDTSSESFAAALNESGVATRQMIASIDSVNTNLEKHNSVIKSTLTSVTEMVNATENIKKTIETQSSAVSESSASIEEMVSSINSVNKSSEKAAQISKQLLEIARNGGDKIKKTAAAILEIHSASGKISEAIGGIARIAATTNLLSMNAAIEAAHAGDAGKGFAVVAEEIRKLANDSQVEAKTIKVNVKDTIEKIANGTKLSEEVGKAFSEIMEDINNTVNLIMEISSAMSEQRAGAHEILHSMEHLVRISAEIGDAVIKEAGESTKLITATKQLDQVATEIYNVSTEQKLGGQEIINGLEGVQEIAQKIHDSIEELNSRISSITVSE